MNGRVTALAVLLAACGLREPDRPRHPERTSESPPESFFGIAGLSRTSLSRSWDTEWGHTNANDVLVHRAHQVVCRVPYGSFGTGEYGATFHDADIRLSSQHPVRFYVRHRYEGHRTIPVSDSCVGYELPDKGECRQVFERSCSHEVCTPSVGIQAIPGSGTLKGRITMDLEPVVGATVVIGSLSAFTDERGGFVIEAGPGTHVVEIYGAGLEVQRATATLGSGEDAVVAISIRCDQVDSGSCCKF